MTDWSGVSMNVSEKPQPLPFYDEAAVAGVLRMEQLISAMEHTLADFSAGQILQPVRSVFDIPQHRARMGIMPAVYGDVMGSKLVNVYPSNLERGLPTHLAMIALFRSDTGEPIAVMDGRLITEMRTAAVSAVATKLLAPPRVRKLAILGSGVQARAHVEALQLVRDFEVIDMWSRNMEHAQALAKEVGAIAVFAEDAVRDADVIVTATNSPEPVLKGAWLKAGALVNAVGAVGPTRRELDQDAMAGAVVVDSREAAMKESGDVLMAGASIYAELGEIISGTKAKPQADIIVFKSLGIAAEDIAAAKLVWQLLQ